MQTRNEKIKTLVKNNYKEKALFQYLNSNKRIYPISIDGFFPFPPYSPGNKYCNEFALSLPFDAEEFYDSIREEYDYNCQFVMDNIDRFFDIFADMRKVYGLGDTRGVKNW